MRSYEKIREQFNTLNVDKIAGKEKWNIILNNRLQLHSILESIKFIKEYKRIINESTKHSVIALILINAILKFIKRKLFY